MQKFFKLCLLFLLFLAVLNNSWAQDTDSEDFRGAVPHVQPEEPLFNKDSENRTRRAINSVLERVHGETDYLLQADRPPFESAIVIYYLQRQGEVVAKGKEWDDHRLFMKAFDKGVFLEKRTKKTRALQILFAGEGEVGILGIVCLVPYLSQNLLTFLPVGGTVSTTMTLFVAIFGGLPAIVQTADRLEEVGKYIFEKPAFTPSKNDKKPHILKLEVETRCCNFSIIKAGAAFSVFNGVIRAAPYMMMFWDGFAMYPLGRAILVGPLGLILFEKAFYESQKVVRLVANKLKTEEIHMMSEKKRILRERLIEARRHFNAPKSDRFVDRLYDEIRKAIDSQEKEESSNPSLENAERGNTRERVWALSLLFLKRTKPDTYQEAANIVLQQHVQETELYEAASQLAQSQPQNMVNLIGDIDNLPKKSNARMILENLAVYFQGASATGRFLITQWAVQTILCYWGSGVVPAFYSGIGVATVDLVFRAVSEWLAQETTFLSLRRCCNTKTDFWPLRWGATVISSLTSSFFTLPAIALVFKIMGNDVPLYIKLLVSIALAPSEFSSFFDFFTTKYERMITGMATTYIKTTKQKRAWLNAMSRKVEDLINELDQITTEQLYYLTQEGL